MVCQNSNAAALDSKATALEFKAAVGRFSE